ncbi:hypothetical protein DICVIV_01214 [Dictyocaulus viviparus]|uniref:Uncharacterized protein n=1 Tax=Dictyocaulus viviparus TaxID=29172 RepID=A0A0D8Y9F4_DICVI|nr:hypothetical protein DICVIV_01214 [Dictyocaulus viviparus]
MLNDFITIVLKLSITRILQLMEDTTSGWFTIDNGTMLVWEGVCMLKLDKVIYLFKIRNEGIFSIKIPIANVKKVSSDGYWDCAEILGCFGKAGATFYYHADCIKSARQMLMVLIIYDDLYVFTDEVTFYLISTILTCPKKYQLLFARTIYSCLLEFGSKPINRYRERKILSGYIV